MSKDNTKVTLTYKGRSVTVSGGNLHKAAQGKMIQRKQLQPEATKKTMTAEEWLAEGERRFGPDHMLWKFECPMCKHVASIGDFKQFKDKGATPDDARRMCIGRYLPKEQRCGLSREHSNPKIKQPCDYAAFGLFQLSPVIVDGQQCFAFAEHEPREER